MFKKFEEFTDTYRYITKAESAHVEKCIHVYQ